jgi:hypothetical protein
MNLTAFAQEKDNPATFKKTSFRKYRSRRLLSYYKQDGAHSPVSGEIGSEKLTDLASNIVVAVPINDNDVLTICGISTYTSASSSNINPFTHKTSTSTSTGASGKSTSRRLFSSLRNSLVGFFWSFG